MNVIVTAYNPNWPALYEQEAQAIRQILGKELIAIHHIGSTSVPGLFSKPIIDIMPVVAHIEAVDPLSAQFEALGYEVMGGIRNSRTPIFSQRWGQPNPSNPYFRTIQPIRYHPSPCCPRFSPLPSTRCQSLWGTKTAACPALSSGH